MHAKNQMGGKVTTQKIQVDGSSPERVTDTDGGGGVNSTRHAHLHSPKKLRYFLQPQTETRLPHR